MIATGLLAPPFAATTTRGEPFRLEDHRGRYVVIYFYPRAFTPGCTRQAVSFHAAEDEIRALGAEIVGISVDDYKTQCDFAAKLELGYALIADQGREISRTYGVLRKWLPFDRRVTFIVDPKGVVVARFQHEILFSRHAREVVGFLKGATES